MRNIIWIVVAAVIAAGGYMLFTGRSPQEVVNSAADAVNAKRRLRRRKRQ